MKVSKSTFTAVVLCLAAASGLQAETIYFTSQLTDMDQRAEVTSVSLMFRVYTQQFGGQKILEETQKVEVTENGSFRLMLGSTTPQGIPASVINGKSLWVEYERPGWPSAQAAARHEVQTRAPSLTPQVVSLSTDWCTFCQSCGSSWPVFAGDIRAAGTSAQTVARGLGCSGSLIVRTITFPRLCCR